MARRRVQDEGGLFYCLGRDGSSVEVPRRLRGGRDRLRDNLRPIRLRRAARWNAQVPEAIVVRCWLMLKPCLRQIFRPPSCGCRCMVLVRPRVSSSRCANALCVLERGDLQHRSSGCEALGWWAFDRLRLNAVARKDQAHDEWLRALATPRVVTRADTVCRRDVTTSLDARASRS